MEQFDRRKFLIYLPVLALLLAATVYLGVGIAKAPGPSVDPLAGALFLLASLTTLLWAGFVALYGGAELRRRRRLARAIVFSIYLVAVVVVGVDLVLEFVPALIPQRVLLRLPLGGIYLFRHGTPQIEYRDDVGFKSRPRLSFQVYSHNDLVSHQQVAAAYNRPVNQHLFQTDSLGFRNACEATTADVVVLGDSFAEMSYHALPNIWPVLLAQQTGRPVRNLGVSGYGTTQEAVALRNWGLSFRPRVVLLTFYEGNDVSDCANFEDFRRSGWTYPKWLVYRKFKRPGDWYRRRPVAAIAGMLLSPFERIVHSAPGAAPGEPSRPAAAGSYFNPIELRLGDAPQPMGLLSVNLALLADGAKVRSQEGWPLFEAALRDIRDMCRSAGAEPILLYAPTKEHVYLPYLRDSFTPEALHRFVVTYHKEFASRSPKQFMDELYGNLDAPSAAVKSVCESLEIKFLDLTPALQSAAGKAQMVYFPFDSHWNEPGNRLVADTVAERLERILP